MEDPSHLADKVRGLKVVALGSLKSQWLRQCV